MAIEDYINAIKKTLDYHQGEGWLLSVYDLQGNELASYTHFKGFDESENLARFVDDMNSDSGKDYRLDIIGGVDYTQNNGDDDPGEDLEGKTRPGGRTSSKWI